MGQMRVDVKGLDAWSAQCGAIAGELAAASGTAAGLPRDQATSMAVSTGQTLVNGTATVMAARVRVTGTSATEASRAYAADDGEYARRLDAVSPGPVVV